MLDKFIDYFKMLEIEPTEDIQVVLSAYRTFAKKHHPDLHAGDVDGEEKLKIVNQFVNQVRENPRFLHSYLQDYYKHKDFVSRNSKPEEEEFHYHYSKRPETDYFSNKFLNSLYSFKRKLARQEEREKRARARRNNIIDAELRKKYSDMDKLSFHLFCGTVHVMGGMLDKIGSMKKKEADDFTSYIIRNRQVLSIGILATILASSFVFNSNKTSGFSEHDVNDKSVESESTESVDTYTLMKRYEVVRGDDLGRVAKYCDTTPELIMKYNNMPSQKLRKGDIIYIPYIIDKNDLSYYTSQVDCSDSNLSLEKLATFYSTDVDTLKLLNSHNIRMLSDDTCVIFGNQLIVPNFITRDNLSALKQEQKVKEK